MIKVQLPGDIYNAVMNVLAKRPYEEVHRLIAEVERQRIIIEDVPVETETADNVVKMPAG